MIEIIHVASFGSVEGVHGLPVLGGPDVDQLPGVLQHEVSLRVEPARLQSLIHGVKRIRTLWIRIIPASRIRFQNKDTDAESKSLQNQIYEKNKFVVILTF